MKKKKTGNRLSVGTYFFKKMNKKKIHFHVQKCLCALKTENGNKITWLCVVKGNVSTVTRTSGSSSNNNNQQAFKCVHCAAAFLC